MRYCKHTEWLNLAVRNEDVLLQNTDRLQTILEDLPNPDKQCPSLVVFIGNRSKAIAIKGLAKTFSPQPRYGCKQSYYNDELRWGETKISGRRTHGEIHLHIHPPSVFSSRPVLLAEGDLPSTSKLTQALATEQCHETASRVLNARDSIAPTLSESANRIYFKLLSPFTDVFCFFADDVGRFKPIVQRLALWLDLGRPSTLPRATRPKLLIVTERTNAKEDDESDLNVFKRMLRKETTMDVFEQFSDIRILSLAAHNKNLSNKARHRELFECLLNFSDQVREARINTQTLFSARHFAAFFHYALDHMVTASEKPFSFVHASRIENPISSSLQDHLLLFLQNIHTPQQLLQFAIPTIASSLVLDGYPADMHLFNSSEVFRTLYQGICRHICRVGALAHAGSKHMILPSIFIRLLETEFSKQVEAFAGLSNVSSSEWHQKNISAFKQNWSVIYSDQTCLMCLMERPQYGLPCGHIICENCIRRHGDERDIWTFEIHQCFLCGAETSGISVKVIPPTATVRLLSIDGGGVRGIIPLVFLQALEEKMGLPYPVQGHFHLIIGSSSGGITGLALGPKGLPVEDCIYMYERLAQKAFKLHSYLQAILASLFTDGIYPARNLEAALKKVMGEDDNILDCSPATAMGIRVAVVASTLKPEPFLFTNYNGLGNRDDNKVAKYSVLRGNARVWEIARCTSAAPGIFTLKKIAGLGKFQDGGLTYNNPTKLGLAEIKSLRPNDPSAKRSALKVSLGTGKASDDDAELHGLSSWWRDLWFLRLCRALWFSMDSQESSDAICRKETNSHDKELKMGTTRRRGEYFRFNMDFQGRQPRLDDSSKMPKMKALAQQEVMLQSNQLDQLARCLIAEFFVFELELDSIPRKENGRYSCTGYILCCHRAGPTFDALLGRLIRSSAAFFLRGRKLPGSIQDRSSLARDGNFRKRVCFDVTSKNDLVSLQLQERGSELYNISGSPFSVNWLIDAQGLGRQFGWKDGVKRKRKGSDDRRPVKRRRL